MTEKIKYTTDGKKVVIIGNLNSKEKIVQEIFVTETGESIPSGENFIVKTLLDSPGISWKEKREKEIEERYEQIEKEYELKTERLNKLYRQIIVTLSEKISVIKDTIPNLSADAFNMVTSFLNDEYKFIVFDNWSAPVICDFNEFEKKLVDMDRYYEGLKLLTLFGKTDGSLEWKISQYKDGSGSNKSMYPFKTYAEAKSKAIELLGDKDYSESIIDFFNEHKIHLDEKKLKAFNNKKTKNIQTAIGELKEKINKFEKGLLKYK